MIELPHPTTTVDDVTRKVQTAKVAGLPGYVAMIKEPEELPSVHRKIMRQLCLGKTIEQVCEEEQLPIDQTRKVVNSPLFQQAMAQMQAEIDANLAVEQARKKIEGASLQQRLRDMVPTALSTIEGELTNFDPATGANAGSRLRAAEMVIGMEGSLSPERHKKVAQGNIIQINFSAHKLDFLRKRAERGAVRLPAEGETTSPALPAVNPEPTPC